VTIAVLLIRSGLDGGGDGATTARPPATTAPAARPTTRQTKTAVVRRYATVQSGDTFGSIAARTGISVERLAQLNPGVSSNALRVGQKLRVK
jgi:LysM repeat protein